MVLCAKAERVQIAKKVRKEKIEKEKGPPSLCTTPPQPKSPHLQGRWSRQWTRQRGRSRRLGSWRKWVSLHHRCQPNSWPRWLQRPGHLLWVRSQQQGSSAYHGRQSPLEGVPHSRKGQEAQEVRAWHSCPPRDLAVSKEH